MSTLSKIVSLERALQIVERQRSEAKKITLANGVFDLLHVGHLRYLEGAREVADFLVVAVNSDQSARLIKGPTRPIVPEGERAEIVAALACTDVVLLFDETDVRHVIRTLKPDFHAKGTDYSTENVPEKDEVEAVGGKIVISGDPKTHSTSQTLERLMNK